MKTEQEIKDRLIQIMLPEFNELPEGTIFSSGPPNHILTEIEVLRWILGLEQEEEVQQ